MTPGHFGGSLGKDPILLAKENCRNKTATCFFPAAVSQLKLIHSFIHPTRIYGASESSVVGGRGVWELGDMVPACGGCSCLCLNGRR